MSVRQTSIALCGSLLAVAGCTGSEAGRSPWDALPPPILVSIPTHADSLIVFDTVGRMVAPTITFPALVQVDPNHVDPIQAPVLGTVVQIHAAGTVRRGETVVVVGQGSAVAGRLVSVKAPYDGAWQPRRIPTQVVWQDDTLGLLEQTGLWLAVGTVSDAEGVAIDADDRASVDLGDGHHALLPARVEWIRRSASGSPYSFDVAVEFRGTKAPARTDLITVVVMPGDAEDSLTAIPAAAVVHLPPGAGVFIPAGPRRYELRWVWVGPAVDGELPVRNGITPRTPVVVRGLVALVEAARDSLAHTPLNR
jgi:hypothetical protein